MGARGFARALSSAQHAINELPGHCTIAYYERELETARFRLRQALARERALLHQWDAFIQLQEVSGEPRAGHDVAASRVASLALRQRQIMVLAGHPSKNIAADLGISQRTVENHRARIMKRTGSKSLPAITQLALAAGGTFDDKTFVPPRLDAPCFERADHQRKEVPRPRFPRATKCLVKSWEMAMKWDWIRESLLRFHHRIVSRRGWRGGLETTGDDLFTEKARIAVETRDPRATPLRYDDRRSDFSQHIGC